ncbi:hypothetical protein [Mucilaginibacter paludis]|uniref:Uncharacterized protein n=1 Tax=Mucilaginibacter paludis DSM 18603 TaxID=714943 RepID=H1YAH0_9SPHI|nr:hypothetical protein [Mucilaginibacter paludis]EHQ27013.1 hypothetical protein Mucpa_2904 [Mucilaginibacter paludis DSM 18603]
MEKFKESIIAFSQLLSGKGHDGHFNVNGAFAGPLAECLDWYTKWKGPGTKPDWPVSVFTYSEWAPDNSRYVSSTFKIDHDPAIQQLFVTSMEIEHKSIAGHSIAKLTLRITDPADIPTKKQAIQSVKPDFSARLQRKRGLKH